MFYSGSKQLGFPDQESQVGDNLSDDKIGPLINEFEKSYIVLPKRIDKPFVLAPIGLIASGKTTFVRAMADKFSLLIISTDQIRKFLENKGYNLRRTSEIAYYLISKHLKLGYGIAIDADLAGKDKRELIDDVSKKSGIPIVWVHINTPEEVILQRLHESNDKRDYRGAEAIKRYFIRKELHNDLNYPFVCIFNGAGDLNSEIAKAKEAIENFVSSK